MCSHLLLLQLNVNTGFEFFQQGQSTKLAKILVTSLASCASFFLSNSVKFVFAASGYPKTVACMPLTQAYIPLI